MPPQFMWRFFMRLTTKGRYAVTAMLDLAIHAQKAYQPQRHLFATGNIAILS